MTFFRSGTSGLGRFELARTLNSLQLCKTRVELGYGRRTTRERTFFWPLAAKRATRSSRCTRVSGPGGGGECAWLPGSGRTFRWAWRSRAERFSLSVSPTQTTLEKLKGERSSRRLPLRVSRLPWPSRCGCSSRPSRNRCIYRRETTRCTWVAAFASCGRLLSSASIQKRTQRTIQTRMMQRSWHTLFVS